MAYHFRNLVFEGGGVKGIAYVGALQFLKKFKGNGRFKKTGFSIQNAGKDICTTPY